MTTIHVELNKDEAGRLTALSSEFTSYCYETGKQAPDDPLRCLLGYFERLAELVMALDELDQAERRTATLKAAFPDLIR